MSTAIAFNTNDLQTAIIETADIDHESTAERKFSIFEIANSNTNTIPYEYYPKKIIPIAGQVNGAGIVDLDGKLDTFRGYFLGTDKNLDIGYGGGTRRYIATATKVGIKRPGGLSFALFSIEFTCKPFGMSTSSTNAVSATGRTLGTYNDAHTFLGNAPYQSPIYTYTLTAVTGGTAKTVSFGNLNTGQQINITRTWANSDVVVIDTNPLTASVKVNGNVVAFTGAFPTFAKGSQTLTYSDNFTTRTFNIAVPYYPRFL